MAGEDCRLLVPRFIIRAGEDSGLLFLRFIMVSRRSPREATRIQKKKLKSRARPMAAKLGMPRTRSCL